MGKHSLMKTQPSAYIYLGANPLHAGLYANVINLMEEIGVEEDLVLNQLLDIRHPLAMFSERRFILDQIIQPTRSLIRGRVHGPVLFHYMAKLPYAMALMPIVIRFHREGKRVVLHARTLYVANAVLWIKRVLPSTCVIAELEGDVVSETLYYHKYNMKYSENGLARRLRLHLKATENVLIKCDAILCVSNKLKEVLVERHQLTQEQQRKIRVFPTLASSKRFYFDETRRTSFRKELGLESRYVVVYVGNLVTPWQLPKQTIELFRLVKQVQPKAILLVVSPEPEHKVMHPYLQSAGIKKEDYQLRSVVYEKIPSVLCAADLGVILREKHLMNEVASPGKMGEYLLSGLPVVMTEYVGEYAAKLRERAQILIISDLYDEDGIEPAIRGFCSQKITPAQRIEFSRWAKKNYSLESAIHVLEDVYQRISHIDQDGFYTR